MKIGQIQTRPHFLNPGCIENHAISIPGLINMDDTYWHVINKRCLFRIHSILIPVDENETESQKNENP